MKNIVILLLAFASLTLNRLMAQTTPDVHSKMEIFEGWVGNWRGTGSIRMGPGEPRTSSVDEHIESRLDGNVIIMEGVGKSVDPETKKENIVHHAFGVLGYDKVKGAYTFRTFLIDGKSTDAWFNAMGKNNFQWGFDAGNNAKIRYTITIDSQKKTWNEVGEYSPDGNNWSPFFEMNLTKVD